MAAADTTEMDDLSRIRASKSASAEPRPEDGRIAGTGGRAAAADGSVSVWAWTSATVLALFSACLLAFPRFLLFLAEPTGGRNALTALERYLALELGVVLGTLAVTVIAMLPNEWPSGLRPRTDADGHPLLWPVTAASLAMALLSYENRTVGTLATTVLSGSGLVGLLGLWMLVFSGPPAISHKTGADGHTSSSIFGNKAAPSLRRRLWKKKQPK